MSSVFGGNEAALIEQGKGDSQPEHGVTFEPHQGVVVVSHLAAIERELRRIRSFTPEYGRQFIRQDGGQAAAATFLFVLEGPKSGNDWYVERLAVSVNANMAAAGAATLYAGQLNDESQLMDTVPLPVGNPSRAVMDGHGGSTYFVYGGGPVAVLLSGLTAGFPVTVRAQAREVLSSFDPALRSQDY